LVSKEKPDPGFLGEKKETKTGGKPEVNWRYWNWFFRGQLKVLELEFCLSKNCAWNWTQISLYLKNQTQNQRLFIEINNCPTSAYFNLACETNG
jgi:hypothetical protein